MINIKSALKMSRFYYILGLFYLVCSILAYLIFHLVNLKFYFVLGGVALIIGLLIELGKKRFDSLDDKLEIKINKNKYPYFRNALRNLYMLANHCFDKGTYLCSFYTKTGTTLAVFVDTKEKAEDYKTWYLSDIDLSDKTFDINENRVTRLTKNDIEKYEYIKITNIQKHIIDPVLAFFKQSSFVYIPVGRIIVICLLYVIGVSGYYFINKKYSIFEDGSLFTYETMIKTCSFSTTLLYIAGTLIFLSGILTYKQAWENYYSETYSSKLSIGNNLMKIVFVLICWIGLILPSIIQFLNYISVRDFIV